jgi:hypothetical protein
VYDWSNSACENAPVQSGQSKLSFFKSTYRVLFGLALIASITLCVRVVIPAVCGVTWHGSPTDEMLFIAAIWLIGTGFTGMVVIAGMLLALAQVLKARSGVTSMDADTKNSIVADIMAHPFPRWAISGAPALGTPLALGAVSQFYRTQFHFPDFPRLLLGCAILGLVSFVICLPLTIWSQKTMVDRFREKYPDLPKTDND